MMPDRRTIALLTYRAFSRPATHYDGDGVEHDITAIVKRSIESWSSASNAVVRGDEVHVQSGEAQPREGDYVYQDDQLYRIGSRISDNGFVVVLAASPVKFNFENTLDATLDFSL